MRGDPQGELGHRGTDGFEMLAVSYPHGQDICPDELYANSVIDQWHKGL